MCVIHMSDLITSHSLYCMGRALTVAFRLLSRKMGVPKYLDWNIMNDDDYIFFSLVRILLRHLEASVKIKLVLAKGTDAN